MKRSSAISIVIQTLVLIAVVSFRPGLCGAGERPPLPEFPAKGKITMVNFGQSGCGGCWMQAPIMRSLEKKYQDSNEVAIVDINTSTYLGQASKHHIELTPTQIFYDKDGKEVYRHQGTMFERSIVSRLKKMGATQ